MQNKCLRTLCSPLICKQLAHWQEAAKKAATKKSYKARSALPAELPPAVLSPAESYMLAPDQVQIIKEGLTKVRGMANPLAPLRGVHLRRAVTDIWQMVCLIPAVRLCLTLSSSTPTPKVMDNVTELDVSALMPDELLRPEQGPERADQCRRILGTFDANGVVKINLRALLPDRLVRVLEAATPHWVNLVKSQTDHLPGVRHGEVGVFQHVLFKKAAIRKGKSKAARRKARSKVKIYMKTDCAQRRQLKHRTLMMQKKEESLRKADAVASGDEGAREAAGRAPAAAPIHEVAGV